MDCSMLELSGHALSSFLKITCSQSRPHVFWRECLGGNASAGMATPGLHDVICGSYIDVGIKALPWCKLKFIMLLAL